MGLVTFAVAVAFAFFVLFVIVFQPSGAMGLLIGIILLVGMAIITYGDRGDF